MSHSSSSPAIPEQHQVEGHSTITAEIVHFTVKPGEATGLIDKRSAMIEAVRAAHPALLDAQLINLGDDQFMDVVRWRTRAEAEVAAADFGNIPAAGAWAAHIAEVLLMTHGTIVHTA
jgi:hypothetical protein